MSWWFLFDSFFNTYSGSDLVGFEATTPTNSCVVTRNTALYCAMYMITEQWQMLKLTLGEIFFFFTSNLCANFTILWSCFYRDLFFVKQNKIHYKEAIEEKTITFLKSILNATLEVVELKILKSGKSGERTPPLVKMKKNTLWFKVQLLLCLPPLSWHLLETELFSFEWN